MNKRYVVMDPVALDDKDMVYSFILPVDTKAYTIKTRGNHEFKVAYEAGALEDGGSGKYATIPSGSAESEDNIYLEVAIIVYVRCETDNEILEVKRWR